MTRVPSIPGRRRHGDQDVERELIQILDSLFAGIRFHYVEPALREPFRHQPAQSRLVVNEQEMGCGLGDQAQRQ